jgi:MoaA/NifB/PqqE/SkfB family radical SAM enzyme
MKTVTDNDPYIMDGTKLLWHMDTVHRWERGERIAPILIDIGATKFCNIRCVFCYGAYQKPSGAMIKPEVLKKLFYDAPRVGTKALTLTGDGEPTLNPGLYDALAVGKASGLDVGMATNAVVIKDARAVVECTRWTRVNLNAATPEGYKRVHGVEEGVFSRVVRNCQYLQQAAQKVKNPCTLGLQMVLVPDCLGEVIGMAQAAVNWGFDYLVIKQFSNPGVGIPVKPFSPEEFVQKATPVLKQAEGMSTSKTKIIVKWGLIEACNGRGYDRCIDCAFLFQVSGNGKCYPCGYLFGDERYCYGDLHEQSYEEIITSERYWGIVKHMREKFNTRTECVGSCRHDQTNRFLHAYLRRPTGENFI